jgi:sulfur-oxidizing protein SoxY
MRTSRRTSAFIATAAALAGLALPALPAAASAWDEVKNSVYGNKTIEDGRGIVALSAPYRPEDMRAVPIGIDAALGDGRTVKTVTFIIDENPTPVVAVFHMGPGREQVSLKVNFRVDRQSDVRAVVEASDGKLYMIAQLVKFAGGQSSCSAPPTGDPAEIAANMGKMKYEQVAGASTASGILSTAKVDLSHPNHTGMVLDQQTLLYTPARYVDEISVKQGDEPVFKVEGSIALSQNPHIEFNMKRNGATELEVSARDIDNTNWTSKFPVAPQS